MDHFLVCTRLQFPNLLLRPFHAGSNRIVVFRNVFGFPSPGYVIRQAAIRVVIVPINSGQAIWFLDDGCLMVVNGRISECLFGNFISFLHRQNFRLPFGQELLESMLVRYFGCVVVLSA